MKVFSASILCCVFVFALCKPAGAEVITDLYGGTYAGWSQVTWTALPSVNDNVDAGTVGALDFVGNSLNPGGYYASDPYYFYFRARVNTSTVDSNTYSDPSSQSRGSLFLLIDVDGMGSLNLPDYGLAYDGKSNDSTKHGLEMQILGTTGSQWKNVKMTDRDGGMSDKFTTDINGLVNNSAPGVYRTGDGYIRSVDGQSPVGAGFGTTSFIDFAVSWNYLTTQTVLSPDQRWRFALASIFNANDHQSLSYEISSGANPDSFVSVGWSSYVNADGSPYVPPTSAVPEPSIFGLFGVGALIFWRYGMRRKQSAASKAKG